MITFKECIPHALAVAIDRLFDAKTITDYKVDIYSPRADEDDVDTLFDELTPYLSTAHIRVFPGDGSEMLLIFEDCDWAKYMRIN